MDRNGAYAPRSNRLTHYSPSLGFFPKQTLSEFGSRGLVRGIIGSSRIRTQNLGKNSQLQFRVKACPFLQMCMPQILSFRSMLCTLELCARTPKSGHAHLPFVLMKKSCVKLT